MEPGGGMFQHNLPIHLAPNLRPFTTRWLFSTDTVALGSANEPLRYGAVKMDSEAPGCLLRCDGYALRTGLCASGSLRA